MRKWSHSILITAKCVRSIPGVQQISTIVQAERITREAWVGSRKKRPDPCLARFFTGLNYMGTHADEGKKNKGN